MVDQIHVRVPTELHRAIKIHCAFQGLSVQEWASALFARAIKDSDVIRLMTSDGLQAGLKRRAPPERGGARRGPSDPAIQKRGRWAQK